MFNNICRSIHPAERARHVLSPHRDDSHIFGKVCGPWPRVSWCRADGRLALKAGWFDGNKKKKTIDHYDFSKSEQAFVIVYEVVACIAVWIPQVSHVCSACHVHVHVL